LYACDEIIRCPGLLDERRTPSRGDDLKRDRRSIGAQRWIQEVVLGRITIAKGGLIVRQRGYHFSPFKKVD
ncbi:MAG: hypothetical protein WCE62_20435, partial [Polyangiales bacterium]